MEKLNFHLLLVFQMIENRVLIEGKAENVPQCFLLV